MPVKQAITVVICTFERPDACEQALRSVLQQTLQPLEVLVCDNGSTDDTATRLSAWERRCELVRYLRLPRNTGTPASVRNLGISHARGDWIAFLDDDDVWFPEKLERQAKQIEAGGADVIATNALRSDGSAYFSGAPPAYRPTRDDVLRANPLITSSTLVRRSLAGFPTSQWMRGVEDYAAWMALADRGARFIVLGQPLLRYEDASSDRLSTARTRVELALARLSWQRATQLPIDLRNVRLALRKTADVLYVAGCDGLAAARARARHERPDT